MRTFQPTKKEVKRGFISYQRPSRILKIWMSNQKMVLKKSIAQKFAKHSHIGGKRAMQEFPMIKNIVKNPAVKKELRLSEEEISWLEQEN